MARNYSVNGNAVNTQSSTLPLVTLISSANIRPRIYDMTFGSAATPADNAARYILQRSTSPGTPGSSITPQALDPGDPVALATSGLAAFSVGPTLTANALLLQFGINQRASWRWAPKDGKEIVLPAATGNGIAILPVQVTSAFDQAFSIQFEE
jgi:hypothetical protein